MSTCIRDGVRYKRHHYTKNPECDRCGRKPEIPATIATALQAMRDLPKAEGNPFTLDGSSPDGV